MSFRARLQLTALVTLAVGLGALLVAGNTLLAVGVRREQSSQLRARAEAQIAALSVTDGAVRVNDPPNDAQLDARAWVLDGTRVVEGPPSVSPALDRQAIALGRRARVAERDGPEELRLRAQPIFAEGAHTPSGAIVVALDTGPLEHLQHGVLLGSLLVAALVLLAAAVAIRSAVEGALRPVARMTASAEDWSAHDLDHRFGLGPARDELTGLAATLDGLLARIAASRRHEQRFASEVAHELRTPIAALRARAELALDGRRGSDEPDALRKIIAQTDRVTETIETLLAMARRELDPAQGTVDPVALAREHDDIAVSVHGRVPAAEGEPEVIRRALAPLVANARRHAHGDVAIDVSAEHGRVRIVVRDDGPGLDPQLGERAFERGVGERQAGGAGLGLALARRLARACGGDVVVGAGPGGCFVLELPAVGTSGADTPVG